MYIVAAQHTDCTFAQTVVWNNAEKGAVYTQVCKRKRDVCLASAVTCLKIGGHTDFFVVRRCQAKHDFTDGYEFVCTVAAVKQGIAMFHEIPPLVVR